MESYTNSQIAKYIRQQDWDGKYPSIEECKEHWNDVTLEEGYDSFRKSRYDTAMSEVAIIKDWCKALCY